MKKTLLPLAAATLLLPNVAAAQQETGPAPEEVPNISPEPAAPKGATLEFKGVKLKISGVLYAFWQYDLAFANPDVQNPNGANRFDVNRAYINVEPQISDKIWVRITPDITRVSDEDGNINGNLAFRLKYAYAQFNDVAPGLAAKAGMQHTAYIDFEDSLWQYRVLGPSAYEFFTGSPSSDLGLGAIGKHLDGLIEYQAVVSNGEGYTRPENSDRDAAKYKDLGARFTLAPFARSGSAALGGVKLTAFAQYGINDKVEDENFDRVRTMGLLSYQHELGTIAAGVGPTWQDVESDGAKTDVDGLLFTSFAYVNLPLDLRVLGRYDWYDADTDSDPAEDGGTGSRDRVIAGLAYRFNDMVQVIGDYQHYGFQEDTNASETALGDALFVHLEAKY